VLELVLTFCFKDIKVGALLTFGVFAIPKLTPSCKCGSLLRSICREGRGHMEHCSALAKLVSALVALV
jgi:hypothetical protein